MSRHLEDEVHRRGFSVENSAIIPGWVEVDAEAKVPEPRPAGSPLRCVVLGQLIPEKGTDIAINSLSLLSDAERSSLHVDFIGAGNAEHYYAMATKLRVQDRVRFLGPASHPDAMKRLAGYDVLLFPTREREPFGFVALEAASAGVVPIMTRRIGASEALDHEVHSLHIERTAGSLASALRFAMTRRDQLAAMGRAARERVLERYRLGTVAERVVAQLSEIMRPGWSLSPEAARRAYKIARYKFRLSRPFVVTEGNGAASPSRVAQRFAELKAVARQSSKTVGSRLVRSGLMRFMRPVLQELLREDENLRGRLASVEASLQSTRLRSGVSDAGSLADNYPRAKPYE